MRANSMPPAFATHPGTLIKCEIEERGWSQKYFAEVLGMQPSVVNELLNGRRPLTEKTALMIEAILGIEAEPLLRLQLKYNLAQTRRDTNFLNKLHKLQQFAAML
ncbi:MAG: HigA family addiction module antidote protein [Muribaculaceae bacterium]|nr:HigA family addiction module antidote protein [Muribaculaceae bacterium]MDE6754720.1 HigA family addiction module antidote protein [Muribaculaceae bacterium]